MKGKLFLLSMAAVALATTSCSNDETVDIKAGNAIEFSAVANRQARAAATTTNTIDNFKVYAFTQGSAYMDGVEVTGGNAAGWSYTGTKFWPETAVDFYSVSPKDVSVNVTNDAQTIDNYVANGTEDLLYAANMQATKAGGTVQVNFRHALSQIVFNVKKTAEATINVSVKGLTIEGIANTSTLTWATATTAPHYATAGDNDTELAGTWGTWATPTGNVNYTAYEPESAYAVTTDTYQLNDGLFLMPQTLNPWLTVEGENVTETGTAKLGVNCQVVDIASGVQLWPATVGEYAPVYVSLTNPTNDPNKTADDDHARWMQGKKYIYTLIFGNGAGYTPGPDPEPVLVPITFSVTVDEFQNGGDYSENMAF